MLYSLSPLKMEFKNYQSDNEIGSKLSVIKKKKITMQHSLYKRYEIIASYSNDIFSYYIIPTIFPNSKPNVMFRLKERLLSNQVYYLL